MTLFKHLYIPVSWRTLLKHVQPPEGLDLEAALTQAENADDFSRCSTKTQKALLKDILGDSSELIEPILKSVDKVSVIMLVNFCKFRSSC